MQGEMLEKNFFLLFKINKKILDPLLKNNHGADFSMSYKQSGKGFLNPIRTAVN